MNRTHLKGALVVAAALLLATEAQAQNPQAATPAAKAGDKADKAAEKAADKVEKAGDKAEKAIDKASDKARMAEDRTARKAREHDAQREKLKGVLKGPVDDSLKQELRRHAERVARLERIKALAMTEKDTASSEKASTLLGKENDRHDKWMTKHAATGTAAGGAK